MGEAHSLAVDWLGWVCYLQVIVFTLHYTIIFYLVMLYSIINPLKEFSKASYNIPWLVGVILVSILLRVDNDKIKNTFRIYSPLIDRKSVV